VKLRFYWWERDIAVLLRQARMNEFTYPCRIRFRPVYLTKWIGST
jgi:hypothetical protein